ncbi:MAG: helix-turn-helix transcriptional regulator [Pseudomonadota bacterium]|nr:helix-turn-helix transcriptional regulator [Pseudomonadota bacterium]
MLTELPLATKHDGMSKLRTMPPERLRAIREEMDIETQREMAALMNVDRVTYVRWETGVRKITGPAVILAELLLAKHRDARKIAD